MTDIYEDIPVGIDLGTTNSCIAYWNGKEVKVIPNRIGDKTTPSTIYFLNNSEEYLVGEYYQKYLSPECQKIYSIKRIIGRDFKEKNFEEEIKKLHYNIIKDDQTEKPLISITQNEENKFFTPECISSLLLKKLVNDAQELLMKSIKKVVITVPAYFDDAQRSATIEAAKLVDLEVIRIINEPTAAALSYGLGQSFCPFKSETPCFSDYFKINRELRKNKIPLYEKNSFCLIDENKKKMIKNNLSILNNNENGKNVLVFDLGGGTFDLAILQLNLQKKEYEVKSKLSDKYLGGDDFDNKLVEYCLNKNGIDLNKEIINKKSLERLRNSCEQAKKILSQREEAFIQVDNFIDKRDILLKITRYEFENEICKELFDKLSLPFDKLLDGAKLSKDNIDEIILVGGSTKMPKIKEIINRKFSCKINDEINPDEVVAYGAAIQAAMLMTVGQKNSLNGVKLFDITPISLGTDVINMSQDPKIKELGNKMSVIIPKWSKIPIEKKKRYRTIKDNQETMQICIFEGENDYLKDNKLLDRFTLCDLPKLPKGQVQCIVTFEIDANNLLNVKAVETSKGIENEIKIKSFNKKKNKIHRIGNLSESQFEKEKNEFGEYNIEMVINNYKNSTDVNIKLKILENYNENIIRSINNINPYKSSDGLKENNVEKYFFYVYQLFESYEEMLNLKMDENIKKNKVNSILENIKKYINIFKFQNCYYIKQFIDLFKNTEDDIFMTIFLESITKLNEMGEFYIENAQKFSRYYSKLYFEEVINLYNKYNISQKEGLCNFQLMSKVNEEKTKSELKLEEINSNAISLISQSKNEKKLIGSLSKNQIISYTGFTFLKNKVNISDEFLTNDEYNLILDELEKIKSRLKLTIKPPSVNLEKDIMEEKAICLANIVKIKFLYLKGQKYHEYLKNIDDCMFFAGKCGKNNSENKWYQEILELKTEIEKKQSISPSIEFQETLKEIDSYFNKSNKMEFINYIY